MHVRHRVLPCERERVDDGQARLGGGQSVEPFGGGSEQRSVRRRPARADAYHQPADVSKRAAYRRKEGGQVRLKPIGVERRVPALPVVHAQQANTAGGISERLRAPQLKLQLSVGGKRDRCVQTRLLEPELGPPADRVAGEG